jgi:hypothetical protein
MFKNKDAALAAGVATTPNKNAPTNKGEGDNKHQHFTQRLSRRLASLWWLDLCSMAVLLAVVVSYAIERLTGGAV